jgi:outer membrane biosynthesis protein TonB
LFNQAALDAAMKSAFTPALQNNHPIAVWIVLPYRFTLQEN